MNFKSPQEEHIDLLEEKIKTLEELLRIKDSEIKLYRNTLELIGVKFQKTLQQGMCCNNPLEPITFEVVNIYYNENIAVPIESERKLKMIEWALNSKIK